MSQTLSVKQITEVKDKLRELKEEWISNKPGRGRSSVQYIDKDTVIQILEYATHGITQWHFSIEKEWKEEIYKNFAEKGQPAQWGFDGYVYHVRGTLTIEGLGSRTQYGKKVAEGGAKNQDSAYQAAASTCLSKCASMFGVGEKLYVKNQIQTNDEWTDQNQQMNPNQQGYDSTAMNGGAQYQNYQMQQNQQQWTQPNQQHQWGQHSSLNGNWNNNETQNPWSNFNQPSDNNVGWNQMTQEIDQAINNNTIDFPFENVPANNEQQNNFQAQPQGQVQEQNFQAKTMGAPVINDQTQTSRKEQNAPAAVEEKPKGSDQQQLFLEQVNLYNQHRARLGIQDDTGMLPYLRDYFQNENADTSFLNMETIKGFNEYMNTIQG